MAIEMTYKGNTEDVYYDNQTLHYRRFIGTELEREYINLANVLYITSYLLQPVLVDSCSKVFEQLGISSSLLNFEQIRSFGKLQDVTVSKGSPLCPRLDAEVEVPYIASLMGGNK